MSGIQQMLTGGTYAPAAPTTIGQAFGGGFYVGKISTTANGVATHYLIVAPKASGQSSSSTWGDYGTRVFVSSTINGPTNSATLAALGASYQAATFCEGLSIGGYTDWYLPAKDELEVLYYFLKPTTETNHTSYGINYYAVSPEPIATAYSSGSPAQTSAGIGFRTGETNAFSALPYWSSTEYGASPSILAVTQSFDNGTQPGTPKDVSNYVRAIRRIPV